MKIAQNNKMSFVCCDCDKVKERQGIFYVLDCCRTKFCIECILSKMQIINCYVYAVEFPKYIFAAECETCNEQVIFTQFKTSYFALAS